MNSVEIPLPVLLTITLFSFENYCLALKIQVTVGNLLYSENYIIFIVWVKDLFPFEKRIPDGQDTYLWLGLLLIPLRLVYKY